MCVGLSECAYVCGPELYMCVGLSVHVCGSELCMCVALSVCLCMYVHSQKTPKKHHQVL